MNMTMKMMMMMMMKLTWIFSKHQLVCPGCNEVWKMVSLQPSLVTFNDKLLNFSEERQYIPKTHTSYIGSLSEFHCVIRSLLLSTTVTVISGHFRAITLQVGPPT